MAKGIQLPGGGYQIAQVGAVCSLYALASCDDNVGLYPLQLVHPGKELVLIKGYFRQQDQVGAFAVLASMISATVTLRMLYTEESRMTSFKMVAMYFAAEP